MQGCGRSSSGEMLVGNWAEEKPILHSELHESRAPQKATSEAEDWE